MYGGGGGLEMLDQAIQGAKFEDDGSSMKSGSWADAKNGFCSNTVITFIVLIVCLIVR